jgi:hypothetical protein
MGKEDLSTDITFNPCYFSLDSPFKEKMQHNIVFQITVAPAYSGLILLWMFTLGCK